MKKIILYVILFVCPCCLSAQRVLEQAELNAILLQMNSIFTEATIVEFDYEQEKQSDMFTEPLVNRGHIKVKGDSIYVTQNNRLRTIAKPNMDIKTFNVTGEQTENGEYKIVLTAKKKKQYRMMKQATLVVAEDYIVRKLRIEESSGDISNITIQCLKTYIQ